MIARPAIILAILAAACSGAPAQEAVYSDRIVLFVLADSVGIAAMKQEMGEEDFYVAADDENWYRSIAFDLLDSRGIEHRIVDTKAFSFLVGGEVRTYDWSERSGWFTVLYDGEDEPEIIYTIDLPTKIGPLTD